MTTIPVTADNWYNFAACAGQDTDKWFPEPATGTGRSSHKLVAKINDARAVCEDCPALAFCRASSVREEYGVFAGLLGYQRTNLRKKLYDGMWGKRSPNHHSPIAHEEAARKIEAALFAVASGQEPGIAAIDYGVSITVLLEWIDTPAAPYGLRTDQCPQGHKWTPETTVFYGTTKRCRVCSREQSREYHAKKRAEQKAADANA